MQRDFWREFVWVSRHVSEQRYRQLPIRVRAELQLAARKHREATTPKFPFGGSGDDD